MTTGGNSEIWCRSKKPVDMLAITGVDKIEPVVCEPELLFFVVDQYISPKLLRSPEGGLSYYLCW
jgi:hypothetical protein